IVLLCLYDRRMSTIQKIISFILAIIFIGYPIFLFRYVKTDYSANYQLTIGKLFSESILTLKHLIWTYKFCMPLIIAGLLKKIIERDFSSFDVMCLGGAALYAGILVPWTSEFGYYQGPMGPFLGFLTMRCSQALLESKTVVKPLAAGLLLISSLLAV